MINNGWMDRETNDRTDGRSMYVGMDKQTTRRMDKQTHRKKEGHTYGWMNGGTNESMDGHEFYRSQNIIGTLQILRCPSDINLRFVSFR